MSLEKKIKLLHSQARIKLCNANVCYNLWPRATGKTFAVGDRIEHLSEAMPCSQILLMSDSYDRIHDRILPNILNYFINEAGMVEGEDFVVHKKPPEHFDKPIIPLKKYDHVTSFRNGMALCEVSGKVEGSANAYNAQALIVDEAKYVKEENVGEVLNALRGAYTRFGHLSEYRSHWYFTDKFGENIKWLLNKKKLCDMQTVEAVIRLQVELLKVENQMAIAENEGRTGAYNYYEKIKRQFDAKLTAVRKNLVYYCEGLPYENIANLGEKYYRDLRRDLGDFQYRVSVENQDPDQVENCFYPALDRLRMYHKHMADIEDNAPLFVALDYNWRITPMVVAQYGKLPGNDYPTFNIVAGIHTLHPDGGIEATCKELGQMFKYKVNRTVVFCYDHTAIGKRADSEPYHEMTKKALYANRFDVIELYIGKAATHASRFEQFKKAMQKQGVGSLMFNEARCEYLLKSMQQAGTITSSGETKKDKSKEKLLSFPAEETTDYSEAFDILYTAYLSHNLANMTRPQAIGDGLGFR
ncbi:hypothetical protein ACFOW1_01580 [Parasediminibacterium paludis]|uniref:Terminase n=1 Tax=Parasediminibacterium paludis TaxID=908966 RepID=A0ABV8PRD0_9BACT